jgi:hypothetical protein
MFPGKTGHGRGPQPASYGSAERARARRRFGFPRPGLADALRGYSTGLGHRRTASPASCLRPGPARRAPRRRIRARTTRYALGRGRAHPAPARALRARQPQRGRTMQRDHAAGSRITPSADSARLRADSVRPTDRRRSADSVCQRPVVDVPRRGRRVSSRRRQRCIKYGPADCPPDCTRGPLCSRRRQELVITARRPA